MRLCENQKLILGAPGCVDKDTEFLTPVGWVFIDQYSGQQVCQYHLETHSTSWAAPERYINQEGSTFIHIKTKYGIDQKVSSNHRMLWYQVGKQHKVTSAAEMVAYANSRAHPVINIPTTVIPPGGAGIDLSPEQIRVMVAVIADGTLDKTRHNKCTINVKKERKKERIAQLLSAAHIPFTRSECEDYSRFYFTPPVPHKIFGEYWWQCSVEQLQVIAHEVVNWDGTRTKHAELFFSRVKESAEFIQYAYLSIGKTARLTIEKTEDPLKFDYVVTARKHTRLGVFGGSVIRENIKEVASEDGREYCFTMPSGFLVLRRNGCIFITGNCGKTTRLLNIVEEELKTVLPQRIAYVSFTKQAVEEAVNRAMEKFNYTTKDLPFFRTLHSLCFSLVGAKSKDMMQRAHYTELGNELGYLFGEKEVSFEEGYNPGAPEGDRLLHVVGLARNRKVSLEEQWHDINDYDLDIFEIKRLARGLKDYKEQHGMLDFTDLLEELVQNNRKLDVDVVVIDEAQDLTQLQWDVCKTLFPTAKRVYIGGDDDQSLYSWAGSCVDTFLALEGEQEVLGVTHRLPRTIYQLANHTISRVGKRFPKAWKPREEDGSVQRVSSIDMVDLTVPGTWLILARNGYRLSEIELLIRKSGQLYEKQGKSSVKPEDLMAIRYWERLRKGTSITGTEVGYVYAKLIPGKGVERGAKARNTLDPNKFYTEDELRKRHGLLAHGIWHDVLEGIALGTREYYISVLRNGGKLQEQPRIKLSTIHASKGGEADNVALLLDMSYRTFQGYQRNPDNELRTFYVGITRARQSLTLIAANSQYGMDI